MAGVLVRQPYTGFDFISLSGIYEFGHRPCRLREVRQSSLLFLHKILYIYFKEHLILNSSVADPVPSFYYDANPDSDPAFILTRTRKIQLPIWCGSGSCSFGMRRNFSFWWKLIAKYMKINMLWVLNTKRRNLSAICKTNGHWSMSKVQTEYLQNSENTVFLL